ncbi:MAG: hypothetical protein ABR886_03080 [Dehalococcoidales bacterium]|jgi:hypothetical protein
MTTKRKRGAPLGNQNAIKHGYYSRTFNAKDRFDLDFAAGMEGISEEIALLRFEIKKAISGGNIDNLVPLVKASVALEKLIRTHHRIFMEKRNSLDIALENVIRNVLVPLGTGIVDSVIASRLSGQSQPDIN